MRDFNVGADDFETNDDEDMIEDNANVRILPVLYVWRVWFGMLM